MVDTQLDRIENMLKILVGADTTIELEGTIEESKELRDKVKSYKKKEN